MSWSDEEPGRDPESLTDLQADAGAAEPELLLFVDPEWSETDAEPDPPVERVVGGWMVGPEGVGRFSANPEYEPLTPSSPTDPVDAVLQCLVRGEAAGDELLDVLDDVVLGVALHVDGSALVIPAPDQVESVPVTTSPRHRDRLPVAGWRDSTIAELATALPESGVDVLLNPGAPASMRVLASSVRAAAARGRDRWQSTPGDGPGSGLDVARSPVGGPGTT